jgi:hypothetical protein
MKRLLYAATALGAIALASPVIAAPILTLDIKDGVTDVSNTSSATGAISFNGSSANFIQLSASGTGVPIQVTPNLGLITLSVVSSAAGTVTIDLLQSGLDAFAGGTVTGTFTANGVIGGPGPTTEEIRINGVTKESEVFPAGTTNGSNILTATAAPQAAGWSDEEFITASFSAPGQTLEATIELITTTPEPTSIALMGVGLLGLGMVSSRKRRG